MMYWAIGGAIAVVGLGFLYKNKAKLFK